jgi:hypothetical protein
MTNLKEKTHVVMVMQANEAKELGFEKLGDVVLNAVGPITREENELQSYAYTELEEDTYKKLWKIAMEVISYHDVEFPDIQNIDDAVSELVDTVIAQVEESIGAKDKLGKFEPKVPGQQLQVFGQNE